MALENFSILIQKLLNKDPDIVSEEASLLILDRKYDVFMAMIGKDTNNTRHITRKVHFARNGKKFKMHKIDWCEVGLQLEEIETKNVRENELNTRMKYIMVRLDN